jgi:small subunit ribosomal protein S17e
MGRIKSTMVKKAARQLIEKDKALFTDDFEHNKKLLADTLPSKPIRNKVAGYITRLIKMQKTEKKKREKKIEEESKEETIQAEQY